MVLGVWISISYFRDIFGIMNSHLKDFKLILTWKPFELTPTSFSKLILHPLYIYIADAMDFRVVRLKDTTIEKWSG